MGRYGRNFEVRRAGKQPAADPREARLVELLEQQLNDLQPGETPLSRVTISHRADGNEYQIRDAHGNVVGVLTEADIVGDGELPKAEALRKAVSRVVCTDCGEQLIEGESGLCGPCEGKAIKDLMGMWDDDA